MKLNNSFPFFSQHDQMDCGPTCLKMVAKSFGRNFKLQTLRNLCDINRSGVSVLGITNAAEKIGMRTLPAKLDLDNLKQAEMPCILHWRQNHFVVLYKVSKNKYSIADPGEGLIQLEESEFTRNWVGMSGNQEGIAVFLSPKPEFYDQENETITSINWSFLLRYFTAYKKLATQLFIGLLIGCVLQLIVPFLTKSIVDVGINTQNINFIYIVLFAQIAIIIGRVSIEFIRSWILLHISTRVNVSILTDFLIKLMKLPMGFFDTKMTGDILQRMNDQKKIETFLTGPTLNTLFSMFNLIVFSVVMVYFNLTIFLVFASCSLIYVLWIMVFLKKRRQLNYRSFELSARNQSGVVELITGMQEIKLNNCEQQKRWDWEHIQAKLFKFNVKTLSLNQYQSGGATLINESKNLIITFLSAKAVIDGGISFGAMIAIQYIVGQLNSPIEQLIGFVQGFQDAKISLERLNEIYQLDDEQPDNSLRITTLPVNKELKISNLTFKYPEAGNNKVLEDLSFIIPEGKTTAIVGTSGSGKTTILKLLLRFYNPISGSITVGGKQLDGIDFRCWRSECGAVMQDGFIFSDTIERNIAVGDEFVDSKKMSAALNAANINDFVESLPLGLETKIGAEGSGISQGQKQRILIARAVYKNPQYLFFDEATNALDSSNERIIMNNMQKFFVGRTVVVVAHRLSTVSNADNIIVLEKGKIIEQGNHQTLTSLKGSYYQLVKNQLELGT